MTSYKRVRDGQDSIRHIHVKTWAVMSYYSLGSKELLSYTSFVFSESKESDPKFSIFDHCIKGKPVSCEPQWKIHFVFL